MWSAAGCSAEDIDLQRVRRAEQAMRGRSLTYADRQPDSPANPAGVYWEGDTLWVWSGDHPLQRSFRKTGAGWQPGPTRRGPAGTTRCVVGGGRFAGTTLCVGRYQNGGLVAFGGEPRWALAERAGFRDVVLLEELGRVAVLDSVADRVVLLDAAGEVVGGFAVPPASYRMGAVGREAVFVLSGVQPRLSVVRIADGGRAQSLLAMRRAAPFRDGYYDETRDLLWLVGPEARPVRRHGGPITGLGSVITAFDGAAMTGGEVRRRAHIELARHGLVDAVAVAGVRDRIVVALKGSDRLAWLSHHGGGWRLDVTATGLAPSGLAAAGERLAVAARLDDRVYLYDRAGRAAGEILLDGAPRDSLRDIGERLFYGALLWGASQRERFSCNSCHWGTEVDHRKHPGFLETRFEQTRPVAGVGAVRPIFTPGQSADLAEAVHGFVRILDERYWHDRGFTEGTIEIPLKGGARRRLDPTDKRLALLHFLASVPVRPGPYLRTADAELRAAIAEGERLFARDCADCHVPTASLHEPAPVTGSLYETLAHRPLVFGSAGFARAGAGPDYTERGNRISPLMGLSRGGPYFSSGAARTLRDVLSRYTRERPGVHGGGPEPVYGRQEMAQLQAFLRTL